ncbi:unknown [Prevotella sp. CAG:1320]|nr:unknown [Prevotella sp. CAG:1320]
MSERQRNEKNGGMALNLAEAIASKRQTNTNRAENETTRIAIVSNGMELPGNSARENDQRHTN